MTGNDPVGETQEGNSLEASSEDQGLPASLLPTWGPQDLLPLPCPLPPPGAGVWRTLVLLAQKQASTLLEVSCTLQKCAREGKNRTKELIQGQNEQGEPPLTALRQPGGSEARSRG